MSPTTARLRRAGRVTLLAALAALAPLAATSACGLPDTPPANGTPGGAGTPAGTVSADTVRGTIAVVGADPLSHVVLRTAAGSEFRLGGEHAAPLRRIDGLEVRVEGVLDQNRLHVDRFHVVGALGRPAADGILEIDGAAAVLVRSDGQRVRYASVPAALRDHVGHRVWIAGTPGGDPEAWGVIVPGA